jgi:hypothetical protein
MSLLAMALLTSCRKEPPSSPRGEFPTERAECADCAYLDEVYRDSNDHPTILGARITNPYSLDNMTAAYRDAYGKDPSRPLSVTHLYVRFSPKDYQQLARLEETNTPLYDYPLDRQLITEGDYYTAPDKQVEDIPEYYAVVPAGYAFPAGIEHIVLERMNIPEDDGAWEDAALRRTGNLWDGQGVRPSAVSDDNLHMEPVPPIPDSDGSQKGGEDDWCKHHPSGLVQVQNELRTKHDYRPVVDAQVVVRRLFKVETLRTDAQGMFKCSKYFRNKYTVVVKFRNELARVARARPWAIHEQFFPIKVNFGTWSALECSHPFRIAHPEVAGTIATSHWCAAITFNGIQEHRAMCTAENIGVPPKDLNIMLSSGRGAGHGNTFMLNKMLKSSITGNAAEVLIPTTLLFFTPVGAAVGLLGIEAFKARSPDIRYGYADDASFLTTDRYCELVYHELSHAGQYSAVGNNWWLNLGIAESRNPGDGFYGSCCTKYAPRIALAEGWAYFMGHYLSDKKWKLESTAFPEQGSFRENKDMEYFADTLGMSSHIFFLEAYEPGRLKDPDRWVPKGLFWDLIDEPSEKSPNSGIVDDVSGFTPSQLYHALRPDVGGIVDFKKRLLEENQNEQHDRVMDLFAQYGY